MRSLILGALVITSLIVAMGCTHDTATKKGKASQAVANSGELETFYAVRIGLAAATVIENGNEQSYRIDATEDDLEKITVGVRKGALAFGVKRGERLSDEVKISITASDLESVQLSGSGRLEAQNGVLKSSESSVVLSGSGTVRVDGEKLNELTAILSGSGTIDLSGKGKKLDIIVSGSGDVKASDFAAQEVKINLSGSGNCEVDAAKQLNASITGSGSVLYTGDPELKKRVTGSGRISKMKL